MIFTECVVCGEPFAVELDEGYLPALHDGRQLVTTHICDTCSTRNHVEHRKIGGQTFGDGDPRASRLHP